MKSTFFGFVIAVLVASLLAMVIGVLSPADFDKKLEQTEVANSLAFVFSAESGNIVDFETAQGAIHHGPLIRRSFLSGQSRNDGIAYSEQVLKVGWPFTVVRGFVHYQDSQRHTHGALLPGQQSIPGNHRILPFQPVWPGLIFWGLVGGLLGGIRGQFT